MSIKNAIGWTGVLLIIAAYFLITFGYVTSDSITFHVINLLGGIALAWRVWQDRNWSNFFLEIVFIAIAVIAIIKTL